MLAQRLKPASAWKIKRLNELGLLIPPSLHFIPVDFEGGESWWLKLMNSGFDKSKASVVVSTGVSMYLSRKANFTTMQQLAQLAPRSTFAMTFMLALDCLKPQERAIMEFVMKKAQESNTPFVSLFTPQQIVELALQAGFKKAQYVAAQDIYNKYFAKRRDGLRAGDAEAFLISST